MVIPPLLDTLNYSYTINFDGPALKCEKQPFTSIQISYYLSYLAYEVKWVDYFCCYLSSFLISHSSQTSLYIQYLDGVDPNGSCNQAILCQAFNTTYNLEVAITNQVPSFNPSIISYNDQIPVPATRFTDPNKPAITFFAIQQSLYTYMTGWIQITDRRNVTANQLFMTNLINGNTVTPDISTKLPELMANITILALIISNITGMENCTVAVQENIYIYNWQVLIIAYGSAVAMALIALIVGVSTTWVNGTPIGNVFSQLLVTVSFHLMTHYWNAHVWYYNCYLPAKDTQSYPGWVMPRAQSELPWRQWAQGA